LPRLLEKHEGEKDGFFISVNLSGVDFGTLDVIQNVRSALVDSGVDPKHIQLEITESALIGDPERAEQILKGLKALGVSIALDDFGTGYSSLGYLHRFPIDTIKIDRSFVSQIQNAPRSVDIIRAIVGLARNFKLGLVAEGIETEQDFVTIHALGVDMGQGYLLGRPMPVGEAVDFMVTSAGL
jgi:EAL domain-containing protein (putative c-di-GMP-specific phosphodiesterase class I)